VGRNGNRAQGRHAQRRARDRRRIAGHGLHSVHLMAGRIDPDCADCGAPAEPSAAHLSRGLGASWAERQQGDVTATDYQLASLAAAARPGVRWWWGERHDAGEAAAWCYLCDRRIASWARRWPITRTAQRELIRHRDGSHVPGARP
jgi:hypothetical protein